MIKIIFLLLLLIPFVLADTTFFENSNDAFVMSSTSTKSQSSTGTSQGTTSQSQSYTKGCQRELEITSLSKISVNQGETTQINVLIKNNGTRYLKNINVSLEAPIDWKTQSIIIKELYARKNQTINLEIKPSIKTTGNHSIKINARAERVNKTKELQINIIGTINNKIIAQTTKEDKINNSVILNNEYIDKTKDGKRKYIIILLIITFTAIITYFLIKYFKTKIKQY